MYIRSMQRAELSEISKPFIIRFQKHKQATKEQIAKLDVIKTKDFCASKNTIKGWKEPAEREKSFANHISDKELVSGLYKEHLRLNAKKTAQWKMGKGSE